MGHVADRDGQRRDERRLLDQRQREGPLEVLQLLLGAVELVLDVQRVVDEHGCSLPGCDESAYCSDKIISYIFNKVNIKVF